MLVQTQGNKQAQRNKPREPELPFQQDFKAVWTGYDLSAIKPKVFHMVAELRHMFVIRLFPALPSWRSLASVHPFLGWGNLLKSSVGHRSPVNLNLDIQTKYHFLIALPQRCWLLQCDFFFWNIKSLLKCWWPLGVAAWSYYLVKPFI